MPYFGKSPEHGNFTELNDVSGSFDGSTTQFALTSRIGGVAITPVVEAALLISINGVIQEPTTAYTISGTNITFTSAPISTDSFFGVVMGRQLDVGTPSDSTVTSSKLASAFFTGASDIGAAIVDADLFMLDDGAGGTIRKTTASRLKTYIGGNTPSSADGQALGSASLEWSDLYLADGGVIYFGNDQEVTLTHNADLGLVLKHTATADDKPVTLIFQTGETDIAANDVLGGIDFMAPDEATGTDAVLTAAGIAAVSEGDFSSSSNATSLQFKTGSSAAATTKMTLTSAGKLGINDTTPDAMLDVYSTSGTSTDIARFEAAVGSYTGSSLVAANTIGSASTFDLIKGVTDSDGDASGPFTVFQVRGDGRVSSNRGKSLIGEHTTTGYLAANSATIIQIQDCFNDDCSLYRVVGSVGGGYDSEDEAQFRFLTTGTTSQDSGYYWAATGLDDAGTTNALQGANTNQATVAINRATTVSLWFDMWVVFGGGAGGLSFWGKTGYHDQGSDRGFTTFGGKNESISSADGIEFFVDDGGNMSLYNLTIYGHRLRMNTTGGHHVNSYGSD